MKSTLSKNHPHHKQAGMTLIEIGVSLAILASVIGGALALFNSTSTAQKVQQLNTDLVSVRGGVQALYTQSGTYAETTTGDMMLALVQSQRLPTTLKPSGTTAADIAIQHGLGGDMTINEFGADDRFFVIAVNDLELDACIQLASQSTGWAGVKGGAAEPATAAGFEETIAPAAAAGECADGTLYFLSR